MYSKNNDSSQGRVPGGWNYDHKKQGGGRYTCYIRTSAAQVSAENIQHVHGPGTLVYNLGYIHTRAVGGGEDGEYLSSSIGNGAYK